MLQQLLKLNATAGSVHLTDTRHCTVSTLYARVRMRVSMRTVRVPFRAQSLIRVLINWNRKPMEFLRAVRKLSSSSSSSTCPTSKLTQSELEGYGLRDVKLRPYQLDGLSWLVERHAAGHGCILGDEMGLGKTLQVSRAEHE